MSYYVRKVYPRMTPSRLRFLTELEQMGVGEPYVRGAARNHLLRLKWIQGAYQMPDGRRITEVEFDLISPKGTEGRYDGVIFCGVTLTNEGLRVLSEHRT